MMTSYLPIRFIKNQTGISGGEEMQLKMDIQKMKQLREQQGFSQWYMAKRLGYKSANGYLYLESGRCQIKSNQVPLIAEILGVSMNELYSEEQSFGTTELEGVS
jgi:transcriptional regulator with XRE-family HTH domain